MTVHVSFPLDEAQKAQLEKIAEHENITLDALMARLVKQRLDYERWFVAEVQKGIDSAERGELIDHDDVFNSLRAKAAARDAAG